MGSDGSQEKDSSGGKKKEENLTAVQGKGLQCKGAAWRKQEGGIKGRSEEIK